MELNKSWMQITDRTKPLYEKGVLDFIEFAFTDLGEGELIRCPCKKCNNNLFWSKRVIYEHLITIGIRRDYVIWDLHGEVAKKCDEDEHKQNFNDGIQSLLHDIGSAINVEDAKEGTETSYTTNPKYNAMNEKTSNFYKLLEDVEQELYPGCKKFSKLSFIVQLLNIKCLFGLSAKSIDAILTLLKKAFPDRNKVPNSYFKARKIIRELGHDYTKIYTCVNDFILYRGDYLKLTSCPTCKFS